MRYPGPLPPSAMGRGSRRLIPGLLRSPTGEGGSAMDRRPVSPAEFAVHFGLVSLNRQKRPGVNRLKAAR